MKQFVVFAGTRYYPLGGAKDFADSFDTYEEAVAYAKGRTDDYPWAHVWDTHGPAIVFPASED
jgi:hypothetical protein